MLENADLWCQLNYTTLQIRSLQNYSNPLIDLDIYESELEHSSCDDESMTSSKYEEERSQKRGQRTYSENMPSSSQENVRPGRAKG